MTYKERRNWIKNFRLGSGENFARTERHCSRGALGRTSQAPSSTEISVSVPAAYTEKDFRHRRNGPHQHASPIRHDPECAAAPLNAISCRSAEQTPRLCSRLLLWYRPCGLFLG